MARISIANEALNSIYRNRLYDISLQIGLASILIDNGLLDEAQAKLDDICELIGKNLQPGKAE